MISGVLLSLFDSLENYGRRLKPGSEYAQKLADSLEKDLNYLIRTNELAQYLQDGSKETSDPNLAFIINQIFDLKQKIQTLRTGEIINETPQMPSGAKNMGFQIEDNNTITFSKNYNPILPSSNKTTINFLPEE